MRNKIYKLLAIVMIVAIMVTSATVVASAQQRYEVKTVADQELINPIYEEIEAKRPQTFSVTPKRYFSSGDLPFDTDLCIDDNEAIGVALREAMVEREANLDVYYVADHEFDNTELRELIKTWSEIAFLETENSFEGDYLRYHYSRISIDGGIFVSDGTTYYYHLPVVVGYYTTKAQEDILTEEIKEVIDSFGFTSVTTDREKSDIIYRYITKNVYYDHENLKDDDYTLKFTAYAAMMNKTAVCQGYATLYYRMARECGLNTRVITGQSFGENHAWNIVELYGKFYYLDSTWDAGDTEFRYYLNGTKDFVNHTLEEQYLTADFMAKYPMSTESIDLSSVIGNIDGFAYEIYMSEVFIFAYGGNEEHVVVPGEICGYTVKQVNKGVFDRNHRVKSITFSEGIKRMGESAIEACENLTAVHFPSTMQIDYEKYTDSVKSGYTAAPIYCSNLETITVASGNPYMKVVDGILYSADEKAVILCPDAYKKDKVTILDGVIDIAPFAFDGCEGIKEIDIPDSVKMIGYWAFCSARNISKVEIPEDCRFIGQFAFANTKIEEIHIPKKVDTILGGAFGMETDLKEITIDLDNQVFYIENGALIKYDSKNETRAILDYETDNSATAFTVPDNVWEIDQYAFAQAQNIEKVILHDGVKYVRSYAFENCDSLTHFAFANVVEKVESYTFLDCDNLMSVIIPDSVTEIGEMLVHDNNGYTIYGESGSIAESYAANNSLNFKETDEFVCTSGHTVQKQNIGELSYHNVCTVCGDCAKTIILGDIAAFAQFATTEYDSYQYTGAPIEPKIDTFETPDGVPLVEGVDYEISGYYLNENVGTAYIEVKGKGNYGGTGYIYFQIDPISLSEAEIGIEYLTVAYDGYEKCPIIQIEGLTEFEDFQVTYENNINPGTARAIITAWRNYEGTVYVEFEISEPLGAELREEDGVKYYYYNGVRSTETGLVEFEGKQMYINKGRFFGSSGVVTIDGRKMYINKGYFTGASGLVTVSGKKMYISKGYFLGASGFVTISGKKAYINKGYFTGASGLVTVSGKKIYINKGYFLGSSGLVTISGKKAYINKGYFTGATGIVKIGSKRYYIKKGYAQLSFSGKVKIKGKTYKIKKGIVK